MIGYTIGRQIAHAAGIQPTGIAIQHNGLIIVEHKFRPVALHQAKRGMLSNYGEDFPRGLKRISVAEIDQ